MKGESSRSRSRGDTLSHSHVQQLRLWSNMFKALSLNYKPDWTSLPDHVLQEIASLLTSRNDIVCLRGACKHFRRLLPPPSPSLFPHPAVEIPAPISLASSGRDHFLLRESTVYAVEPRTRISDMLQIEYSPWIARIQELETPQVRLRDILTRLYFGNLFINYELRKPINLLNIRLKEITKSYRLGFHVSATEKDEARRLINPGKKFVSFFLQKLVVTSWPDVPQVGFSVMALHDKGLVHVWRRDDKNWSAIKNPNGADIFTDIIYHDKKFFVLNKSGRTIAVDPRTLMFVEVAVPVPDSGMGLKYLVKSCNDLFMVGKSWPQDFAGFISWEDLEPDEQPIGLFVYELKKEICQWVMVSNELQDRVIFVGEDVSFSLSANELPGFRGNLIYVSDHVFACGDNDYPGWNVGVFTLVDGKGIYPEPLSSSKKHRNLFWPPPKWLHSSSVPAAIQRRYPLNPFD